MINIVKENQCTGCMACYNTCPYNAIKIEINKEGFAFPKIDENKCVKCNICEKVCPQINKKLQINKSVNAYACKNIDEKIRLESSSGGMFNLFAKYILDMKGVVFGAAFDNNVKLNHIYIESECELNKLMGSKYLQSNIGKNYIEVKKFLQQNRFVLFVGTTCQIAGLKAYLCHNYDNLYTVDLICKSVSSPLIFNEYLNKFYKNQEIQSINFKDKSLGWHKFSVKVKSDKHEYVKNGRDDLYMQGFFKSLYNRKSCENCSFKYPYRISDITIADCWGIEKINKEFDDNKGTSAVIINSERGQILFNNVSNKLKNIPIDISQIKENNPYFSKQEKAGLERKLFWFLHGKISFKVLMKLIAFPYKEKTLFYMRKIYYKITRRNTDV